MSPVSGSGLDNADYVRPWGTADDGEFQVAVTPTATNPVPGWEHTRLRVAWTAPDGHVDHDSGAEETLVVPLVGSFRVEVTEADGTAHTVELRKLKDQIREKYPEIEVETRLMALGGRVEAIV